jgi:ABC-2 type transport system permease protein
MTASFSRRRVRGIVRKELREFRRKASIMVTMSVIPLVFLVQPLVVVFGLRSQAAGALAHQHVLLYLLGIPALVPVVVAGYAVVGERELGTLEPVLATPIRREELLLGKAIAAFIPSVGVAYLVFALFLAVVKLFADPAVATALIQWPQVLAQIAFTPLIAVWSIWLGMAISTRAGDVRVAQQLGVLASLPTVFLATMVASEVIPATGRTAAIAAVTLVLLDLSAMRVVAAAFNRERLITNTH